MTAAHFIYIPMVVIFGIVIGFILGGRSARDSFAMEQKTKERRAVARAEREARIATSKAPDDAPPSKQPGDE